ncbi:hypothetical protein [Aliiroseovarius sp.]|uniref:hypothetical protein n=1 Tax=Aliiroseovarius sp. TaxID=1872442 RepID=UPI003BAD0B7A
MKLGRSSITSSALCLAACGIAWAGGPETVSRSEVAARHCTAQWAKLVEVTPNAWSDLPPIEVDPTLDPATTTAFNKYVTAVVALAEYFGQFTGLTDSQYQTAAHIAQARARFELAMCLVPTEEERDLITALAHAAGGGTAAEIEARLFDGFDTFFCTGADQASEQIFRLEPTSPTFADDIDSIMSTAMRACEAG